MNDYKKYLPSRKFISAITIILIIIGLFFAIKGIVSLLRSNKLNKNQPAKITVGELIQKDSNNNGIADWEEYLWGLDPYKNGASNKEFIMAKKDSILQNNGGQILDPSKPLTDNEALSQEFFAAIVSLQQTGTLDDQSLKTMTDAIGSNVKTEEIKDVYTSDMMTIVSDSATANNTYQEKLAALVTKYSTADIGSELTFIIQGLNNKDPQALYAAKTVGIAYQDFGKEFIKIPVPRTLANLQLSAANNYEKTGQTINDLTLILTDQIKGMKALLNYKKYNDLLGTELEKIGEFLQ